MKAADIEWGMLRGALIALGMAIVISAAMIGASYQFWETGDLALKRAERTLRDSRTQYRTVDEQEAMIATYYPRFLELEVQGIIGGERRLDWIESLRAADENIKLPRLTYSIATQEPYVAEFPLAAGVYQTYASNMDLNMGLLHGEDLFSLLSALDETTRGLYSVDACSMVRAADEPGNPTAAHVSSKCRLRWFTIRKPGDAGSAS